MGIISILVLLTIISIILGHTKDNLKTLSTVAFIVSFVVLAIFVVALPISRYDSGKQIKIFQVKKLTIEQQRKSNTSEIERAALIKEIIDNNAWLNDAQYDRSHIWFNIYYKKEIMDLKPIK